MSQPLPVEFKHVTKRFGDSQPVLSDITLSAYPYEFVSIIGPSGCGKSTLLRLIAGLTSLSEGQLTVFGHPTTQEAGDLSFVFQEPTLLPWLTVRRNIEVMLRLRHTPAALRRDRSHQMLELVGLADFADSYPRQLSGGQKMRVSLARALTLQPSLLLLDEPFGALDEMTRDRLNEELLAIHKRQKWTAFFVTHSVAEAVFLSDRVIVLAANPGRIVHEIPIDLPGPRTAGTRHSSAYLKLVADVSRLLRSAESLATPPAV
ncbi:MAG TPA: ABC transporter ATP-binding protein [Rariglobus sp.]|jgi:NitT/TauT family transport system ATP-binding protein|nr:ABC transporter ATP-binding protein [Rariglobus sp.]